MGSDHLTPWHSLICSFREGSFLRSRRQIQHWDRIEPTFPMNNLVKLAHRKGWRVRGKALLSGHWRPIKTGLPMQFVSSLILEPLPARLAGLWGAHVCRAHVPSGVRGLGEVDLALCATCSAVWLEAQEVGIVRFTCMHLHTLRNRRLKAPNSKC